MIIKVLDHMDDEFRVLDEIENEGVDPLRVAPVHAIVGNPIAVQELGELLARIQPIEPLDSDELDSYYAQNIPAWQDEDLSPDSIEIPHHIGLRVVVASILEKYGTSDHVLIQIG